mgnify:CR=1 FL=1
MPIDTEKAYTPQMNLPVYLKLVPPRHNDYEVNKKYDIRVADPDRQDEKGGDGPYNYAHECLCVGTQELKWREVSDALLALLGHTPSRSEAIETVCVGGEEYEDSRDLLLVTFLRLDRTKEWVTNSEEVIEPPFTVEDYEGNSEQ